jgi:hypothetical protein
VGLYPIRCPQCEKFFMWFSGNMPDQRCGDCKRKDLPMTSDDGKTRECICGEINARHCPVHNESDDGKATSAEAQQYQLCRLFDGGGEVIHWFVSRKDHDRICGELKARADAANERVRELERVLEEKSFTNYSLRKLKNYREENVRLREALEFIGDEANYYGHDGKSAHSVQYYMRMAREALKQGGE